MFRKFAKADIIDVRYSSNKLNPEQAAEGFSKLAKPSEITDDGYLYVTTRAISSRVNKNNDGWPALELARTDGFGYKTFENRPIFVDHNNDDPDRTRGIVVSSKLHVENERKAAEFDSYYASAPKEHMPPTWIELMLEVDAKEYPKLAQEIIKGNIDSVSMGANIELSKCSVCGHEAENPTEYCSHVQMKGATFEVTSEKGEKSHKKAYEDCYGINFFEISFVFDPADETALISDMSAERKAAIKTISTLVAAGLPIPLDLRKQAAGGGIFDAEDDPYQDPPQFDPTPDDDPEAMGDQPAPGKNEDQMVHEWKLHQLTTLFGASPEAAESFIVAGGDYHDLEAFLQKYPKANVEQAMQIVASVSTAGPLKALEDAGGRLRSKYTCENCGERGLQEDGTCPHCDHYNDWFSGVDKKKEAVGPPGREHHNLDQHQQEVERERQLNHEPQADKMTAPQNVDTLRPEIVCKECGTSVEPDSAGQLICQECGVEVEPEGLDNPDLELAKDTDLRQDKTEEPNPEGEMETELEPDKGETEVPSKSPVRPVAPISSSVSDPVSGEMKFSDVSNILAETDPKTVKRIVSFMEKNAVEVQDEVELARILTESEDFEGTPTIYDAASGIEVHASKTAATQDNADSKSGVKVNTDKKVPGGSAASQSAAERVISDQAAPVESNFKVLAETESVEDTNMENTDKTADRETIKRVEEDGSGVKRTEEITKEYGPMGEAGESTEDEAEAAEGESEGEGEAEAETAEGEDSPEAPTAEGDPEEVKAEDTPDESSDVPEHNPLKEEEKVPAMASDSTKLMAALKLAKLASSLGVIEADAELEFAGELETSETSEEIEARTKMLESVKEAGLSRKRRPVVAGRVPSFKSAGSFSTEVDDDDIESLFL